jgi:hypothetical protein
MPSSRTQALDVADYGNGTHNMPETALPAWANSLGVEVMKCTTPDPTIWPDPESSIRLVAEISMDNGATWANLFDGTSSGGIQVHNKTGLEIPSMKFDTPIPSGNNRRIRGSMTIENGPIKTTMYISLDSESHVFSRVAR